MRRLLDKERIFVFYMPEKKNEIYKIDESITSQIREVPV